MGRWKQDLFPSENALPLCSAVVASEMVGFVNTRRRERERKKERGVGGKERERGLCVAYKESSSCSLIINKGKC